MGKIVSPKKKLDDGKNKVLTKIKVLKQIKITTQNKAGNRLSERSILVSLLSETSSDFLMMSEYSDNCLGVSGSNLKIFWDIPRHSMWVSLLP